MSKLEYTWYLGAPPKPDVYVTRRSASKYQTHRYWNGFGWFEISYGGNRGGIPFTWPKKSRIRKPVSASEYYKYDFHLRKIDPAQGIIEWGEPYKVYDKMEVVRYLASIGVLPKDWETSYQPLMRQAHFK